MGFVDTKKIAALMYLGVYLGCKPTYFYFYLTLLLMFWRGRIRILLCIYSYYPHIIGALRVWLVRVEPPVNKFWAKKLTPSSKSNRRPFIIGRHLGSLDIDFSWHAKCNVADYLDVRKISALMLKGPSQFKVTNCNSWGIAKFQGIKIVMVKNQQCKQGSLHV